MKSIYSLEVLQRILDHWGIGLIEDVTYFDGPGRNIWRHHIDTNQGVFEVYSYPVLQKEYAEPKLAKYLKEGRGNAREVDPKKQIVHSFDRYHVLLQISKKHRITKNQASKDLDLLIGSSIQKAFRVYGTILQIHLNHADVNVADILVSYGWWSLQDYKKGRANVVVDSRMSEYKKLDTAIEMLHSQKPTIEKYLLKGGWFELYFSNETSLHFWRSEFPAAEVHLKSRKNNLIIHSENELYYSKDLRDSE
jgi:hypothetical protein